MSGKVYLVGAGPGDPELLTIKALRVLKSADVVLHDELIGSEILKMIPASTLVRNVGKRGGRKNIRQQEIDCLLVQYALLDLQVVRLKGGDPLIFGRAGEEVEALRRANIEFEIIPGISSMLGAAAAVQIPLTHRAFSSSLVVLTGHSSPAEDSTDAFNNDWPRQISPGSTVVVYMPGYDYPATSRQLIAAGLVPNIPCAVISKATTPDQQIHQTTLQDLHSAPRLPSPTLLVVGEVVRFSRQPSPIREIASFEFPASIPLEPFLRLQDLAQEPERSE
ncbi:MAG: uroporphyrinogen-III C-methyltransferase [Terriglobales bacterium]|jgi:uroporphyrin-III C-methyltransferase|nr:uroporphyrinogen-III C-methyltransferase [Terriglobales bacterium]